MAPGEGDDRFGVGTNGAVPTGGRPSGGSSLSGWMLGFFVVVCVVTVASMGRQMGLSGGAGPLGVSPGEASPAVRESSRRLPYGRDWHVESRTDAALDRFNLEVEAVRRQAAAELEREEVGDTSKRMRTILGSLGKVKEQMPSQGRLVIESIVEELEALLPLAMEYDRIWNAVIASGMHDPSTLKSVAAMDERMEAIRKGIGVSRRLATAQKALPEAVVERMKGKGLTMQTLKEEARIVRSYAHLYELGARGLEIDVRAGEVMIDQIGLLKEQWGAWTIDEANGILFDNDAAVRRYNRNVAEMARLSDRQMTINRLLLSPGLR